MTAFLCSMYMAASLSYCIIRCLAQFGETRPVKKWDAAYIADWAIASLILCGAGTFDPIIKLIKAGVYQ